MNKTKLFFAILFPLFAGCNGNSDDHTNQYDKPHDPNRAVVVEDIGPKKGGLGTKVVVSGENFGNDKEKVHLYFNEKEALILRVQDNAIYALVPKQPGEYSAVRVVVDGKEAVLQNMRF